MISTNSNRLLWRQISDNSNGTVECNFSLKLISYQFHQAHKVSGDQREQTLSVFLFSSFAQKLPNFNSYITIFVICNLSLNMI